ncbi:methyltransferase domain-containing protein [Patescibacteria group bacterium]|nr:methyltransferase domain-containing protein [Patescibacteria group bacterium]MDE1946539.1 methyltransferase domain-containing protein [Patescibacteria group bacterium]MDE2010900.1 methyltransferase domain-containing protein [Patescibacteria group bacterium]MDE2232784.1 methyltransferase domain-containing protein [Patescibacteria group bacterium]
MKIDSSVLFLKASLENFWTIGSVVPSSSYLAKKMAMPIASKPKMVVVELGAGTGAVTRCLLKVLPSDARLFSLELNATLADRLSRDISDKRLELIVENACNLESVLKEREVSKADYIISGLPLGSIQEDGRQEIYRNIHACLEPGGLYIQFQYFMANFIEIKKHFKVCKVAFEWRNFPPAFIYSCRLRSGR